MSLTLYGQHMIWGRWVLRQFHGSVSVGNRHANVELNAFLEHLKADQLPLERLFQVQYVRSSGPGGQNVNKLNTKAVVTMTQQTLERDLKQFVPEDIVQKYTNMESSYKRPKQGGLVISSDSHRSRSRNLQDCFAKFVTDLKRATLPIPQDDSTIKKWEAIKKAQSNIKKTDKIHRTTKKQNRKKIIL